MLQCQGGDVALPIFVIYGIHLVGPSLQSSGSYAEEAEAELVKLTMMQPHTNTHTQTDYMHLWRSGRVSGSYALGSVSCSMALLHCPGGELAPFQLPVNA